LFRPRKGYEVLAGWLSPSHASYVDEKMHALQDISLPAPVRVACALAYTRDSELWDVGTWEIDPARRTWPDFPIVIRNLKEALGRFCDRDILVCYVCGSDLFVRCGLSRGLPGFGIVVVERGGCPEGGRLSKTVFHAEQPAQEVRNLSSTLVRKQIRSRRFDLLPAMVCPEVAGILEDWAT